MVTNPSDLLYFLIVMPIVVLTGLYLQRCDKNLHKIRYIIILSGLLFIVRICLIFFSDSIGVMPFLKDDILFYSLLTLFGILFTILYVYLVEHRTLKELGWNRKDLKKNLLYGFVAYIPLLSFIPLIILLTHLELSFILTWEKFVLAIGFGLILGGIYEETMFRGIIQTHLNTSLTSQKAILLTALIFAATHIGYLPFIGYGIYYIFVFFMGLLLSFLRQRVGLVASAILHGGIVFIFILGI
ncbi:MAG: lysostaphin resistance A-like protein [Candidatus Helarchaeota archaeon]